MSEVAPGDTCGKCGRRVPHPKKPDSPTTQIVAMRMPREAAAIWEEQLKALADHFGISTSEKFWKYKTLILAQARALQSDETALRKELEGRGGWDG